MEDINEADVGGLVGLGTDIPIHFIPAGVRHGCGLGKLAVIFALAYWGMVQSDFFHLPISNLVQAAITDMADGDRTSFDHRQRQNASHAMQLGLTLRALKDAIVRQRDGFADALFGVARRILEAITDGVDGDASSFFAGRLAADSIDHDEQAFLLVHVVQVFIVRPLLAGISDDAGDQLMRAVHSG